MPEKHIFSTGQLLVTPLALLHPSVIRASRNGFAYSYPVSNVTDGDGSTLTDLAQGSAASTDYIRMDLGASQTLSGITFTNVSVVAGGSPQVFKVWVTDNAAFDPPSTGGSPQSLSLVVPTAGAQTLNFTANQTGRYIYLTAGGSATKLVFGEASPALVGGSLEFALIQDCGFDHKFSTKDLFGPASQSVFAVDSADHEGGVSLKIGNASISSKTLQLLIASALTTIVQADGPPVIPGFDKNTLSGAVKLPYMSAQLTLTATDGKTVVITAGKCKAAGVSWPFKLTDFLVQNFELHCFPDAAGVVYTVAFQN